jgi:voltage-gated potassium channel
MASWRYLLHEIIFEADTPAGKAFDVTLLVAIAASTACVMLESVESVRARYGAELLWAEWGFTLLFTAEYVLRLLVVERPVAYARSFFGIVDLMAIVPTYLSVLLPGSQSLLVIRTLRLVRIFRVFKLVELVGEARLLMVALRASQMKLAIFIGGVVILMTILGSIMYLVEGPESGFTSVPRSVYWAVVTMTTVGYGDIAPVTVLGQTLAAVVMIMGYAIIAVPTGIVTSELLDAVRRPVNTRSCPSCMSEGHALTARFCRDCGAPLEPGEERGG